MGKEYLENQTDTIEEEAGLERSYQRYLELGGGRIKEADYVNAIKRMGEKLDTGNQEIKESIGQAKEIANYSGIELTDSNSVLDPRILLYVILRDNDNFGGVTDQRLFAEVLRILEDTESLDKLIKAHPHISFLAPK